MTAYIINIIKNKGQEDIIRMIAEVKENGQSHYMKSQKTEKEVVDDLMNGKYKLENAVVEKGKLKGSPASLDRFNSKNKPMIVLGVIVDEHDKVLGYKIANCNGGVAKKTLGDIIEMCQCIDRHGGIPFQNAQYVSANENKDKNAYIKAYAGCTFPKEVLKKAKNKYVQKAKVDKKENEKNIKSNKLEDIYTKEQIAELKKAKEQGMDIRKIGNPKLSAEQMRELREIEASGFNCEALADPEFSVESLEYYKIEVQNGGDIREIINSKYKPEQLLELTLGLIDGLDISQYAYPEMKASEMSEVRIRLKSGIWKDIKVKADDTWKD